MCFLSPCFHFRLRPRFEPRPRSPTMKFPDIVGLERLCRGSPSLIGLSLLTSIFFFFNLSNPESTIYAFLVFHDHDTTKGFLQCLTCKFPARMQLICSSSYWYEGAAVYTQLLSIQECYHTSRDFVMTTMILKDSVAKLKLTSSCI